MLCVIAISADPVTASGPTGIAVAARIAFFQSFCRKVGVPEVKIVAMPNVWPKPPKNPGILWACLGELGKILAERTGCSVPKMPEDVAVAVAATESTDPDAAERAAHAAKQAEAQALIAAMAPKPKAENAASECQRLRGSLVVTAVVGEGEPPAEIRVVPTRDEEDEEGGGDSEKMKDEEEADGLGEIKRAESTKYIPPDDVEQTEFRADALPVLCGHLHKMSPSLFRLKKWDWRFFMVRDMHVLWWKSKSDASKPEAAAADGGPLCKGTISLVSDPVQLEIDTSSKTRFYLKPDIEAQKLAKEARKYDNRVFSFDADGSEYDRDEWARVIHAHLDKVRSCAMPALEAFAPDAKASSG